MNNRMSRKVAAVELVKEMITIRRPHPMDQSKYDPAIHFLPFEESNFLNDRLMGEPYATFTTDNPDYMQELLTNGYNLVGVGLMKVLFGYWKDSEGHAILIPASSKVNGLHDIGILTSMTSMADCFKIGKYVNRTLANLPKEVESVWGNELDYQDGVSWVVLDGTTPEEDRTITVKYVNLKALSAEQKALVDGCIAIGPKAAVLLSLTKKPLLGQAWRGTFTTPRGLGKGHILLIPWLNYDVVIYGVKPIVTTDRFYFGSMGPLHVGMVHTDRQSFVNFGYHRPGLAYELAHNWMIRVWEAAKSERELRRLLLSVTANLTNDQLDDEGWVLRRLLRYGVSFLRFPGAYRRVVRYLTTKVMQIGERARIPMTGVADYGYVLPDPFAITDEGDVDLDKCLIKEGELLFPDVATGTEVVVHRQPSENSNAWRSLKVVLPGNTKQRRHYQRFAGRGICLLGRGADQVLGRLGGGDMDDSFVIIHDPTWVKAFHELTPYPETDKVSGHVPTIGQIISYETLMGYTRKSLANDLEAEMKQQPMVYSVRHISAQIEMSRRSRSGIGPVVNYGIIDMLMSDPDHKASMIIDLLSQNKKELAKWLEERVGFEAAKLMTNLELVIDGNVKDPTLLAQLGDIAGQIRKFHESCPVYPKSQETRIPIYRLNDPNLPGYAVARSLMCRCLEDIEADRSDLMRLFREREWYLVGPADKDLRDTFPRSSYIAKLVSGPNRNRVEGLRGEWATYWREHFEKLTSLGNDKEAIAAVEVNSFKEAYKLIADRLEGLDDVTMREVAVEVYFNTYKRIEPSPRMDANNKVRQFPDGLLWSPVLQNHFIDALRQAKLSGFYAPCDIRAEYRKQLSSIAVAVHVRTHNVYLDESPDFFVGWALHCPDGKYVMDSGLIEVVKPQAICLPLNEGLAEKSVIPINVLPKAPVLVVPAAKPEDNTLVKMLKRALKTVWGK